jgi:uncharacterized membrane protein
MKLSAGILYGLCVFFGFCGVVLLLIPFVGLPLLFISYLLYLAAGKAKRKAREIEVSRQHGG